MKHFKSTISLLLITLVVLNGYSQGTQQKSPAAQKKVVRINPVKVDTTDPNKKAMNKFSKEQMYNTAPAPKQLTPEELSALNLFNEGSKNDF